MDGDTGKLVIVGILLWLLWQRQTSVDVSIPGANKQCIFPDGTIVTVPFNFLCPYSPDHGGESVELVLK
jgi:hypothetical protein